ncbi:MAG: hypothetical protein VYE68_15510 [Acidobacteriota bacterium]|nr:hypothetical protein [Acidobacteriota bacterium]
MVLLLAPWSTFWDRNWFVEGASGLQTMMGWVVVRGAVSGIGIVNLCAGLWELVVAVTGTSSYATLFGGVSTSPLREDLSEPGATAGRAVAGAGPRGASTVENG